MDRKEEKMEGKMKFFGNFCFHSKFFSYICSDDSPAMIGEPHLSHYYFTLSFFSFLWN